MRSLIPALVLMALAAGGLAAAGGDEQGSAPRQCPPSLSTVDAPRFEASAAPCPVPAASVTPQRCDAARIKHLQEAADHLQAAGLGSLADHVRSLLHAPTTAEPPQDASRWRPHEGAPQVLLTIKLVEIDEDKLAGFGFDPAQLPLAGATPDKPFGRGQPSLRVVGPEANLRGLVEALRRTGDARVLSEPTIVTIAGRPASFHAGGEIPLWAVGPDGQPILRDERYGTAVDFVPQLTAGGNLRLHLRCEFSEVDGTKTVLVAGKKNPVIQRTGIDTAWEMKPGQTLIAARHGGPDNGGREEGSQAPAIVMLVTPELIKATAALAPPGRSEQR